MSLFARAMNAFAAKCVSLLFLHRAGKQTDEGRDEDEERGTGRQAFGAIVDRLLPFQLSLLSVLVVELLSLLFGDRTSGKRERETE